LIFAFPIRGERLPYIFFGFVDQAHRGLSRRLGISPPERIKDGAVLRDRPLLAKRRRDRQSQIDSRACAIVLPSAFTSELFTKRRMIR
jgi:hypothetical protein